MTTLRFGRQRTDRRGFTLIEVIVGMVLGLIVLTSVVQMPSHCCRGT